MPENNEQTDNQQPTDQNQGGQAEGSEGLDLESLLNEYDQGSSGDDQSQQGSGQQAGQDGGQQPSQEGSDQLSGIDASSVNEALDWIRQEKQRREAEETQTAINNAVKTIKENETLQNMPDSVVEGYLYNKGNKDKRFLNAYANRHIDPQGWNKVLKAVGDELASELKQTPDEKLTSDRDAARAAVSGQSTGQSSGDSDELTNEQLNEMSDAEFEAYKQKLLSRQGG